MVSGVRAPGEKKDLVICADGTWNDPADQTNIFRIAEAAKRVLGSSRWVMYHPGVGTSGITDRVWGGISGLGVSRNIRECYAWLVNTYQQDDRIWIFGFSRGAYTARSLAGLIRFAGILAPQDRWRVDEAFWHYRADRLASAPQSAKDAATAFRNGPEIARAHKPVDGIIRFLGVFDTVGSLGLPLNVFERARNWAIWWTDGSFHDTALGSHVQTARQCLAIDEQRGKFTPALWTAKLADSPRDIAQAWFPGVHSDVGGGYPDKGLSGMPLAWMLGQAAEAGLDLRPEFVSFRPEPSATGAMHDSMTFPYTQLSRYLRQVGNEHRKVGDPGRPSDNEVMIGEWIHTCVRSRITDTGGFDATGKAPYRPTSICYPNGTFLNNLPEILQP